MVAICDSSTYELIKFIDGPHRNMWLFWDNGNLEVYVRKSKRLLNNTLVQAFDIANCTAATNGTGSFTAFHAGLFRVFDSKGIGHYYCDNWKEFRLIYVENIQTIRFRKFFIDQGYDIVSEDSFGCCMQKVLFPVRDS